MAAQQNANSEIPAGAVSHGARHYLTANGRVVGYVQGLDWNANLNQLDVETLDDVFTAEHVLGAVAFTFTARFVKVVGVSLINAGIAVPIEQVLGAAVLGLALVDRPTGKVVRHYRRCAITGISESFAKGVLTVTTCSGKCINVVDEDGLVAAR